MIRVGGVFTGLTCTVRVTTLLVGLTAAPSEIWNAIVRGAVDGFWLVSWYFTARRAAWYLAAVAEPVRVSTPVAALKLPVIPLWFGKGGWLRVWELDRQVAAAQEKNVALERRNAALAAEVKDLKTGTEAVEERARYELGLVRKDEVFFQLGDDKQKAKR